jgi:hypothetical protein
MAIGKEPSTDVHQRELLAIEELVCSRMVMSCGITAYEWLVMLAAQKPRWRGSSMLFDRTEGREC